VTWVHDRIFAAGGERLPATWRTFADQTGISAVLHLRPERPAVFEGPPPRSFLWLDVQDESQADAQTRWLAARFLEDCLGAGQAVLLHSSLGRHRGRWAFVAYRILSGRSAAAALREAAQRPWLGPYRTDSGAWEAFAAELHGRAG